MDTVSDQTNLEAALIERGVNAQLAAWIDYWMEREALERTVAWYDRERLTRTIGPGVLVAELRKGGRGEPSRAERDRAHVEELRAWLRANCSEYAEHWAAVPALGRLRYLHRHAPLEDAELAARVRADVTRFEEEST